MCVCVCVCVAAQYIKMKGQTSRPSHEQNKHSGWKHCHLAVVLGDKNTENNIWCFANIFNNKKITMRHKLIHPNTVTSHDSHGVQNHR